MVDTCQVQIMWKEIGIEFLLILIMVLVIIGSNIYTIKKYDKIIQMYGKN